MRKRSTTAAELVKQLQADPDFKARQEAARARERKLADELRRAEAPLVKELRAAGFAVESAWDLVNTVEPYTAALPILLAHLQRPYPTAVREGIARALGVRGARFAWGAITTLYRREHDARLRDGLAAAIAAMADASAMGEVMALIRDRRNGPSRVLLLRVLARSRKASAHEALMELAADEQLRVEVQAILQRWGKRKRQRQGIPN